MSVAKKIILSLIAVLIIIQFIRPEKNQSAAAAPDDLFANYQSPDSIKSLIKAACYDCHSNNTHYPWYAEIQPVAWWLNDHIEEGKGEFNFSEFASYPAKKADHKMEELLEMVKEEEMPLQSYTIIHEDSRLSESQRRAITRWAAEIRKEIQQELK